MEHKSEYAERINMFKYSQYMNLLSGEKVTDWIKVTEKACDHEVTALYVDAITGGMSKKKASLNGDAGVCIDMMPVKPVKRYMADYRYSQWWCRPAFGSDLTHIPGKTQLLVLELEDGTFCVMVPVVNDNYRCVLKGTDKNVVTAELSSWYDKLYTCNGLALVYAQGKNPSALIENCVKEALKLLNNGPRAAPSMHRCRPGAAGQSRTPAGRPPVSGAFGIFGLVQLGQHADPHYRGGNPSQM